MRTDFIIILAIISTTIFAEEKKFGYYIFEYNGVSDPLSESERESSPVKYHFRLSRKNKREKEISATFQVTRKVVDLKIQNHFYRYDVTSGYQPVIQRPPVSFCYDQEPILPLLKKCLGWSVNKSDCSLEQGNYTLSDYSLEDETRLLVGDQTFYGKYLTKLTFLDGEDYKITGVDLYYEIKEPKNCNLSKINRIKLSDEKTLKTKINE